MTGSVADAPGDVIVVSSECRDIDRETLEVYKCVVGPPAILFLMRGFLPSICALRG